MTLDEVAQSRRQKAWSIYREGRSKTPMVNCCCGSINGPAGCRCGCCPHRRDLAMAQTVSSWLKLQTIKDGLEERLLQNGITTAKLLRAGSAYRIETAWRWRGRWKRSSNKSRQQLPTRSAVDYLVG
jgi:hypothetical protein